MDFFCQFRVLWLPEFFSTIKFFFRQNTKFSLSFRLFAQFFWNVVRSSSSNGYIQWSNLTFRPRNHVQFYVFEKNIGVRESQNSNSRDHKTEIFIDNVPFTLHPLVGLLPNSTTSKELTIWPRKCLQKRALKLVSWLPEVEDFLFLPLCSVAE